jgi:peroxiredoxin
MSVIGPGTPVPAFKLATEDGASFTEKDLKGERTVFVFYPFAFSPVCTDQLQLYEAALGELTEAGMTKCYGVSCDSSWSQKAFREKLGVSIEQLSDFEPKGAVCKALGVLHEGGFPERALIAIDGIGTPPTVRWSYQAAMPSELPSVGLLREGVGIAFDGAITA